MTQQLSPAAEAVLDAALPHIVHRYSVAAALRAAADHVYHDWSGFNCVDYLCEIAAELEGAQ